MQFKPRSFDLVVSSLMFHYIEDLFPVLQRIHTWMVSGGQLIFSTEHAIFTAAQGMYPDAWVRDEDGNKLAWKVDHYMDEGARNSVWFVEGVIRYHRKMSTLINYLIDAGFQIRRMLEPHAIEEAERRDPDYLNERKRPAFVFIVAESR